MRHAFLFDVQWDRHATMVKVGARSRGLAKWAAELIDLWQILYESIYVGSVHMLNDKFS